MLKKLHRNKGSGEESSVELTPTPEERSPDPKTEAEISRSVVVYDTEHVVSHGGTSQYNRDEVSLMASTFSLAKMTNPTRPQKPSPEPKTKAISHSIVVYDNEHAVSHGGTSQYKKDEVSLMASTFSLAKMINPTRPQKPSPEPKTEPISHSVVVYDTEHVVSHGGTSQYKKDEVSLMTSLSSLVKMTHISIRPVFRNHHPTSKPKPYLAASSCMVPNTSFPMAALASTTGMGLAPQLADSQHSILRGSSSLWNKVVCKIQLSYRPCWLASA